jgi:hypothetical protein
MPVPPPVTTQTWSLTQKSLFALSSAVEDITTLDEGKSGVILFPGVEFNRVKERCLCWKSTPWEQEIICPGFTTSYGHAIGDPFFDGPSTTRTSGCLTCYKHKGHRLHTGRKRKSEIQAMPGNVTYLQLTSHIVVGLLSPRMVVLHLSVVLNCRVTPCRRACGKPLSCGSLFPLSYPPPPPPTIPKRP